MKMTFDRALKVLGIAKGFTKEELKQAHRKLCSKWHPDKNIGSEKAAEEKFKEIQEAYEYLEDAPSGTKEDAKSARPPFMVRDFRSVNIVYYSVKKAANATRTSEVKGHHEGKGRVTV